MWKRTLITGNQESYSIGPQWDTIRPYAEKWLEAKSEASSIEELAKRKDWIDHKYLELS